MLTAANFILFAAYSYSKISTSPSNIVFPVMQLSGSHEELSETTHSKVIDDIEMVSTTSA